MPIPDFTPINDLEIKLIDAFEGRISDDDVLRCIFDSDIFVPSANIVDEKWIGFQPVLYDREGIDMVSCFTDATRIGSKVREVAPYCLTIKGASFLCKLPSSYGLVINPGSKVGFEMDPEALQQAIKDFC